VPRGLLVLPPKVILSRMVGVGSALQVKLAKDASTVTAKRRIPIFDSFFIYFRSFQRMLIF
jgi:hypothetical protein